MQIGRNWTHDHQPKTPKAQLAQELAIQTLNVIHYLQPRYFFIENPRAKLRKMPFMETNPLNGGFMDRCTVWYCHYGELRAKPTDIWTNALDFWSPQPECHNKLTSHPANCCCNDHVAAVRGSTTGSQGMDAAESAKIPFALSQEIKTAILASL